MDLERLRRLLAEIAAGTTSPDAALERLRSLPFEDLGYAHVDHHRALRQGAPEVILGQGKTREQIGGIARALLERGQNVLVTRVLPDVGEWLLAELPDAKHAPVARVVTVERTPIPTLGAKPVALLSAGTSDLGVAEECAETLRMMGARVERVYDVGVAGIHRLLHKRETLDGAAVCIVVAGMEGALASVVGGLVAQPVIAVPTSVGYGASFGGVSALLGMLTSCASGVTVVNIDNGFGAAFAAARILRGG